MKRFGQPRLVDWPVLMHFGLEEEVHQMVDFGGWSRILCMEEPVYRDITLEVLSIFEVDKSLIGFSLLGVM